MARYDITSLNYIASGNGRTFVNLDMKLRDESKITVFVLRKESERNEHDPLSSNVLTEQKGGRYEDFGYICRDFNDPVSASRFLSRQEGVADVFTAAGYGDGMMRSLCDNGLDELNAVSMEGEGRSESLVLDENRENFVETGNERLLIRLQMCNDTPEYLERIHRFKSTYVVRRNKTFVFDGYIDSEDDSRVNDMDGKKPMYDMCDVCVKSQNQVADSTVRSMDKVGTRTEDIYVPQCEKDPIGFVQSGKNAYMMFGDTDVSENVLRSSLWQNRDGYVGSQYYNMTIRTDGKTRTNLYQDPETVARTQDFSNSVEMRGIRYNYVAQIDTDSESFGTYTNGNQYGSIYQTKNSYDSNYSMRMDDGNLIRRCRTYCGVGHDQQKIYLKYYDGTDYVGNGLRKCENELSSTDMTRVDSGKYPYQKIEYFIPNSVVNTTRHKSNFFSVRMCGTDIGERTEPAFQQMRKDITNAIREICQNVAPVNTQLLDVQFSTEGK